MIKFKRLDHVQICIPVGKEEEARAFYRDIIGLTEIPKPQPLLANGGLWFAIADIQLHIGVENEINKSKRHPAFEVERLQDVKQYLQDRGVQIKEDIHIEGCERFSFFDPFGNRVELLEKTLPVG